MATVIFYQKPDCLTNAVQRRWLEAAGHQVVARNLLREPWTRESLAPYFRGLPVAQWFNPRAPRIKSGELDPRTLDADQALALMLADPLLIRRPLLRWGEERLAGFDLRTVAARLGLDVAERPSGALTCARERAGGCGSGMPG